MSPAVAPWGVFLTEAVTMFLVLLALGLGFVGAWSLWSRVRR